MKRSSQKFLKSLLFEANVKLVIIYRNSIILGNCKSHGWFSNIFNSLLNIEKYFEIYIWRFIVWSWKSNLKYMTLIFFFHSIVLKLSVVYLFFSNLLVLRAFYIISEFYFTFFLSDKSRWETVEKARNYLPSLWMM